MFIRFAVFFWCANFAVRMHYTAPLFILYKYRCTNTFAGNFYFEILWPRAAVCRWVCCVFSHFIIHPFSQRDHDEILPPRRFSRFPRYLRAVHPRKRACYVCKAHVHINIISNMYICITKRT